MNPLQILRTSILTGSVYFIAVGICHILLLKISGIYVYYDIFSTQYQDHIIALLSIGWGCFFIMASESLKAGLFLPFRWVIIAGTIAILVFAKINLLDEVNSYANGNTLPYWLITGILTIYLLWLVYWYVKVLRMNR